MPQRLSCARGHQWETDDPLAPCPVCGSLPATEKTAWPHVPDPVLTVTDGPRAPADADLPRVPGYEVLALLGRGGMGVVFKARHLRLNRLVALKMIRTGADASPEDLARFRTEA